MKNIWPQKKTWEKRFRVWPQNDLTSYLRNYCSESSNIRMISFSGQNNPIYWMPSRSEIWGFLFLVGLCWNRLGDFFFTVWQTSTSIGLKNNKNIELSPKLLSNIWPRKYIDVLLFTHSPVEQTDISFSKFKIDLNINIP